MAEIKKLKALMDKYSATGNRPKLRECIDSREKMLKIQQSEDW